MRGQLFVCVPRHLLPETSSELPPLMKFDIVEMTGAMTALSQDRVRGVGGGGGWRSYKLPHLCTPALLLQGEGVMEVRVISESTGDTSFGGESAEAHSQRNNDTRRFE